MLTTLVKFESNKGQGLVGSIDTTSVGEFQKLQKKITSDFIKMGDDMVSGSAAINKGSKLSTQAVVTVSMETIGTGDHKGFYTRTSQESRFDSQGTYDAFVDFCDNLLTDILAKAGSGGSGHGKKT